MKGCELRMKSEIEPERQGQSAVRPWRAGASVHPGGGIPAVLGGAMIAVLKLLAKNPA